MISIHNAFIVVATVKNLHATVIQHFKKMSHKVFVYGTLKRNEPNHYWLTAPENGTGTFVRKGTTVKKYPLIIATKYNIPFLLHSPGDGNNVKGEIYEVDDLMLTKLDDLEGHPEYYVREQDDITNENSKETEKCWIYFLKNFKKDLLQQKCLVNYSSKGDHGLLYLERSKRGPIDYNYTIELKNQNHK